MLIKSLEKAFVATVIFLLLGLFQTNNWVREKVEDTGLDPVMKVLSTFDQQGGSTNQTKAVVFAFDNDYMRKHGLYDKDDINTFGYTFPRGHIARFFSNLDNELKVLTHDNGELICPKAVFVDFDTTFPSAGVGQPLSTGDQALIDHLTTPKCYKVLIARTSRYNFIAKEAIKDPVLQAQLDNNNIIFVSPNFHIGGDQVVRRYQPTNTIDKITYPSASLALWQIDKTGDVNTTQAKQFINHVQLRDKESKKQATSERNNVNANWILVKHYRPNSKQLTSPACETTSHWTNLKKVSLNCAFSSKLNHISDLHKTLLLLGSTEQESNDGGLGKQDYHKVLNFISDYDISGIDLHANILMTLLHLDQNNTSNKDLPQLLQLDLVKSLLLVFFGILFINLAISILFAVLNIQSDFITYWSATLISAVIFFVISATLLLSTQPVWFNWVIVMVLFNSIEWILLARKKLPLIVNKYLLYPSKKLKDFLNR